MKVLTVFVLSVCFSLAAIAQDGGSPGTVSFHSVFSGGILTGETGAKPVFQVIPGIAFRKFSVGAGAGYDNYRFRTLPLFADARMNFLKQGFLYVQGGYNFPLDPETGDQFFKTTDRFRGGYYFDFGTGVRLPLRKMQSILMSIGYSQKQVRNTVGYTLDCVGCEEQLYNYDYRLGRIVMKLSWELKSNAFKN